MGVLTRGTTFTEATTVTAANLEAMITGATVSGLKRQHFDSSELFPITRDATALSSPAVGEPWMKSLSGNIVVLWNGTAWVPAFDSHIVVTAKSDVTITAGQGVAIQTIASPTSMVVRLVVQGSQANFLGVAAEDIAAGEDGIVIISGEATCTVDGAVSAGALMGASAVDGSLEGKGTTYSSSIDNVYGIALENRAAGGQVRVWLMQ